METRKTKFILHGGFTRHDNELNRSFFREIALDVPSGGTVLIVYFAAKYEDTSEVFAWHSKQLREQANGKALTIVEASREHFLTELTTADAVFFNGGSTEKLLGAMSDYHEFKVLISGKTVAGSSAGAYMLASYGAAHTGPDMREGLSILPIRVICHFESLELPPSATSVAKVKATHPELELVTLKDCEWRVFNV